MKSVEEWNRDSLSIKPGVGKPKKDLPRMNYNEKLEYYNYDGSNIISKFVLYTPVRQQVACLRNEVQPII